MNYPISEIFFSLQGEGPLTWNPSIFLRFWWCNLKCHWCDSKYSWLHTEFKKIMTLEQVLEKINEFPQCTHIVFTGGEPSLFQKHIRELREKLPHYTFEIETNGSRKLDANLFDQINVSYKLVSSGNESYEMMPTPSWMLHEDVPANICWKFVCGSQEDLDEILSLQDKYLIDPEMIYIMPLGTTAESQLRSENTKFCVDACMKYWFKLCIRTHILLWWDRMWV